MHTYGRSGRLCLLGAGMLAYLAAQEPMSPQNVPVVKVRPGKPVTEAVAQAGLQLNYALLFDNSSIAIERPVQVEYDDPQHGFEFPPTRFVWLPQRAGIITGVETTPVLQYADLATAHEVAVLMQQRIAKAGWTPVVAFSKDLDSVKRVFEKASAGEEIRRLYGKWQLGSITAEVYVKRHADTEAKVAGRAADDVYLPSVDIMDWSLLSELDEKVFKLRRSVSGSINKSLPLSAWIRK